MNALDGWYRAFNALDKFILEYIEENDREPTITMIRAYISGALTGYKEGGGQ